MNYKVILLLLLSHFIYLPTMPAKCRPAKQSSADIVRFLEEQYGVRFNSNNSLVVFKSGKEKFDDLLPALRSAKESIHLEYFNFRNDSISKELFAILTQKASEGVKIRALFDGFGNMSNSRPLRARHLDSLRARGIEIYEFDAIKFPYINRVLHRDHRKIVVIDGQIGYIGGMNVADYYITGKPEFGEWHDLHMRVEGDVVGELQKVFLDFWNKVTRQSVSGPQYYPGEKDARHAFPMLPPTEARRQDKRPSESSTATRIPRRKSYTTPSFTPSRTLKAAFK